MGNAEYEVNKLVNIFPTERLEYVIRNLDTFLTDDADVAFVRVIRKLKAVPAAELSVILEILS